MAETDYFARRVTNATNSWQELVLAAEPTRGFKSILIVNDDSSNELSIRLNDLEADIINIPAGESIGLTKNVWKIFYYAASGNPIFRVVAD